MELQCETRPAAPQLFRKTDIRTRAISIWIGAECQINPLGCVLQIEVKRTTQSTGEHRAAPALEFTAAIHIKFVNDHTALHIGDADMKGEDRPADSESPQDEACLRTAPVHYVEFAINEPAASRSLARSENPGWGHLFELLL